MNDYPLLRVGIVIVALVGVGLSLYWSFGDSFDDWFSFFQADGNEYRMQINAGRDFEMISVNGHELRVEIADSPEETTRGLSGRESMGTDEGMLFVFNDTRKHTFWMKDMQFPLDILWIRDGAVVEIAADMPAPKEGGLPEIYRPSETANMVLELNAGRAAEIGLEIGSEIEGLPQY